MRFLHGIISAFFMLFAVSGCMIKKNNENDTSFMKDLKQLKKNCSALMQQKYFDYQKSLNWMSSINKDGSWKDIDYKCQNLSSWSPATHLTRLRIMTAAWSSKNSPLYHSSELGAAAKRGIEFWVKEKRYSKNWWWNDIFVPMTLGHIFIMGEDLFKDTSLMQSVMPYLEQAKFGMTGQNRIWLAKGVLFKAILTNNDKLVEQAAKEMTAEIVYSDCEGIRVDGSFHQHGPQLQFGNYGLSYLDNITVLICYFADTRWALSEIAPFRDMVLNGMKWTLWRDVMDITAQGRQIKQNSQKDKNKAIRNSIALLAEKDSAFAAEYRKEPVGNKMFFTADYMIHRTKNFYASFRANSVKTYPVETYVIGDNLLGRYLSDGVMQVMRSGNEYFNVAGCWEWNRLPGTTLPAMPLVKYNPPHAPEVKIFTPARVKGESVFTGGVSDNCKYGAMVYSMNLDGVKVVKSVFFADDIIVALGSGIESNSPYDVATTVEQSLLCGKVERGENWFYHNNIGYSGKNISLFAGKRKGDWKPLWGGYKKSVPDEREIFQLTIDHGKNVRNGSYEYAIYPDIKLSDMPNAAKSYQLLANNETVQAIRLKNGVIMAIFHKGGNIADFVTDSAGAFIITDEKIFAADPTQKKQVFNLTLNKKEYKVTLPTGRFAGQTAVIKR